MKKTPVIPVIPVVETKEYMTWSAWSKRYLTVRRIYALVG
jgi:hypothetical protein